MKHVDFAPTGKRTSRIGLGCGRLAGRESLRDSAKLVEAALELGIRYFDVAPSYGLGTAEDVIGAVIGSSREVTVATKIGVPRPADPGGRGRVRRLAKQVLDRVGPLKAMVRGALGRLPPASGERPRYDFSAVAIRASLEESLERLQRDSVDVFLAHEPHPLDLTQEVAAGFRSLQEQGLITAFGVGVGATTDRWERFGSIWQSCWPGDALKAYAGDVEYVWHGAVRIARRSGVGARLPRASAVVRKVLESSPHGILLVSASTPQRLRELLAEVDS